MADAQRGLRELLSEVNSALKAGLTPETIKDLKLRAALSALEGTPCSHSKSVCARCALYYGKRTLLLEIEAKLDKMRGDLKRDHPEMGVQEASHILFGVTLKAIADANAEMVESEEIPAPPECEHPACAVLTEGDPENRGGFACIWCTSCGAIKPVTIDLKTQEIKPRGDWMLTGIEPHDIGKREGLETVDMDFKVWREE